MPLHGELDIGERRPPTDSPNASGNNNADSPDSYLRRIIFTPTAMRTPMRTIPRVARPGTQAVVAIVVMAKTYLIAVHLPCEVTRFDLGSPRRTGIGSVATSSCLSKPEVFNERYERVE